MHGQSCSQLRDRQSLCGLDVRRSAHRNNRASTGSGQSAGDEALVAEHVRRPAPIARAIAMVTFHI